MLLADVPAVFLSFAGFVNHALEDDQCIVLLFPSQLQGHDIAVDQVDVAEIEKDDNAELDDVHREVMKVMFWIIRLDVNVSQDDDFAEVEVHVGLKWEVAPDSKGNPHRRGPRDAR